MSQFDSSGFGKQSQQRSAKTTCEAVSYVRLGLLKAPGKANFWFSGLKKHFCSALILKRIDRNIQR